MTVATQVQDPKSTVSSSTLVIHLHVPLLFRLPSILLPPSHHPFLILVFIKPFLLIHHLNLPNSSSAWTGRATFMLVLFFFSLDSFLAFFSVLLYASILLTLHFYPHTFKFCPGHVCLKGLASCLQAITSKNHKRTGHLFFINQSDKVDEQKEEITPRQKRAKVLPIRVLRLVQPIPSSHAATVGCFHEQPSYYVVVVDADQTLAK